MNIKTSSFVPSRRQFLQNVFPAGTLFCLGCRGLLALPNAEGKQEVSEKKHKFLEDSGLTVEEVFTFTYQNVIPIMQNVADDMGREKFIDMLEKASDAYYEQLIAEMTKDLPRKDMAVFTDFVINMLNGFPYNKAVTYEIIEKTDKAFEVKYTECLFAKTLREMNASDIGYALNCYPTFGLARGFNPKIKVTPTKNLMKGDAACIERFVWEV